ncbi:MAG: metal-dependent hydrolase [Pyrinomonadaceae bacterium]|nr:metal-dependent hydrolase [Pyrinomonadaceae bacterium]
MPLPVAHGLLGASVAAALYQPFESRRWKILATGAFLGICPDFDYALNWLRISGGGWHHGFTHSIMFALFLGLMTAAMVSGKKLRNIVVFGCAAGSHTLLDYLMTESTGVALWWPFTNHRYRLSLPNPIDYNWDNASLWASAIDLVRISLSELMIFAPILLVVLLARRRLIVRCN